ncbi:MAG: ferrochelatase [Proteobacteria bacterium]|jgi:ferrochelatase|nr:ferrochelatase [Pseudomonadota bacterium]
MTKVKVVIGQLGSPKTAKPQDVRVFLKEFLGDPRVVDLPRWLWNIILYCFVLTFRPKKSAQAYARIWDGTGFPLVKTTIKVAHALKPHLDANIELNHAFLVCDPRPGQIFDEWEKEPVSTRAQQVLVLPQFPQYAESTVASVVDALGKEFSHRVNIPTFTVLDSYHRAKCFIDHSARLIRERLKNETPDVLVISFHGIPLRRVLDKGDLYYRHCLETYRILERELKLSIPMQMTFQSRFGSEIWLGPYTDKTVVEMAEQKKKIAIYCPSFVVDCLETTDEIGHELLEEVEEAGGHLLVVPCLNDDPAWIKDYAQFINTTVNGSGLEKDGLYHKIEIDSDLKVHMKGLETQRPEPMSPATKRVLKLMFLTMFLDLVGFSIIFPMFPALAKHYLAVDPDNFFLKTIFSWVGDIQRLGGEQALASNTGSIVLFGGILGALYSLLQFVAAPMWGAISDKVGRKPVLVISIMGLFLSYGLWFVAGSFTLLILGRAIGGMMSGNLSIASAVVADITDAKNRSKGMAVIGIAFALGFIIGPALGGISAQFNLLDYFPELQSMGVNPFSLPALIAGVLAFINLFGVMFFFPETLPPEKRGKGEGLHRTANPFKLFQKLSFDGVNQTNIGYFFFITAFAGMEFTLTFLAVERFMFTPLDNAKMFIFIGFWIAMIQGGYVRRKAGQIGEAKMAMQGLVCIIPGLLLIGFTPSIWMLYFGLFFLAIGSAMVIPCLTSLVSLYTPETDQGRALGQFRGLGALGRVIGPISASLAYWRFGGAATYLVGAISVIVPLMIVKALPKRG